MTDLLSRLQTALGDSYRFERELGGGGMSQVFLAEETALGRKVVIKVLPPETSAAVNKERFQREIQLAASLQHPHIVPLLTAGVADELVYYVMPYIEGDSLRVRIERVDELPVDETMRIVREVADALAAAHEQGIVHRDIKPDNVLLSKGHALVMDFGVAKALSTDGDAAELTATGLVVGTPAYMAPEQGAGDPNTDHRADIYALGVMAYELLTGVQPFSGPTMQALVAAHLTADPEPITAHRASVPQVVDAVIMRCLEKQAADRWQSALELQAALDNLEKLGYARHSPLRTGLMFGIGAALVLAVVYGLMFLLGLPDWVFDGALLLLVIGFPIILTTGHHERRRALAITGGRAPVGVGVARHFTWRKALVGGAFAFAGLGVLTTGYMAMRALGIGPFATLLAAGVINNQDQIVVADFVNRTDDSLLGRSLTEAIKIGLAQSPVIRVMDARTTAGALQRMGRERDTPLSLSLALEMAEREGARAVLAPEIQPIGNSYLLSARLLTPDASEHVALAENASGPDRLIDAVDELSAKLRERVGESLRSIRSNEPLARVTTSSLEALRLYSEGMEAFEGRSDYGRAIPLLEDAVAIDSTFAMAHRKLGVAYSNSGHPLSKMFASLRKAYDLRDRLTEPERYVTEASYHWWVHGDRDKGVAAYERLLSKYPNDYVGIFNLGVIHMATRNPAEAERLFMRALEAQPNLGSLPYTNALAMQVRQGRVADAHATVERISDLFPDAASVMRYRAWFAKSRRKYSESEQEILSLRASQPENAFWQRTSSIMLSRLYWMRGRLRDAERVLTELMESVREQGNAQRYLEAAIDLAWLHRFRGDSEEAIRSIDIALVAQPLPSIAPTDRPYLHLAYHLAHMDQAGRATALMNEWQAEVETPPPFVWRQPASARGAIALAEGRYADAIREFQLWAQAPIANPVYPLGDLALAYDQAGEADSALAVYRRLVETPELWRDDIDAAFLAPALVRLGELYETRDSTDRAVHYYNEFVELWKDADRELQSRVTEIRSRIAGLVGETR